MPIRAPTPRRRIHDLRHACVTLLGAQGIPLKTIAEIVGPSDIRLTQNIYQHAFMESKREAVAKLDALLEPVATGHELPRVNGVLSY
jgi:integrase